MMSTPSSITKATIIALIIILSFGLTGCAPQPKKDDSTVTLTNVSYDPTREFYTAYNALFSEHWAQESGRTVDVTQSHGGSGSQAMSVTQGLEADVVTLALEGDVQAVADAGLIDEGWINEFSADSAPYTSAIVFLVRKDNPKNILDWNDLIRDDVGVITPNPKTSGGARWNFLAAWAYAEKHYQDEDQMSEFLKSIFENVLVLDAGARGSTTSFVENKQGDVLLAWENEAYLTLKEHAGDYEIIAPSVSILCKPSVAVVDDIVKKRGTADVAAAYLSYLYSDEAQRLAATHFYRPSNADILSEYTELFDMTIEMTDIAHFGGWKAAQAKFFSDGGIFDKIYER